jgi:hypothetical protein
MYTTMTNLMIGLLERVVDTSDRDKTKSETKYKIKL